MVRRFAIGAAFVALTLGATGASMAQSKSKTARPSALATVEAVQMPAWFERSGARYPLTPGTELKDRDQVMTGANSRLLLRMADGSSVKLGENGSLSFEGMRMRGDSVFEAAMKVAEGAFRFTSEFFAQFRGRREVSVTVRTVTAGIRGTDLWGKSTPDRQILCLIEGKLDVTPPGESPIGMDQRLSFYVREKGQSQPVSIVLADQLREWAGETETQTGRGVSKRGGKWKLTASSGTPNRALDLYRDLRNAGYPAEIIPAKVGNKRVYNVRLSNFETRKDAEFVASALKQHPRLREREYKVGT
ncbi:MAG TPA: FecR domain-containing protein [Burkholderiales bacterium]|nr:FecR domain-containing protein [Burkholderiales bacterium]